MGFKHCNTKKCWRQHTLCEKQRKRAVVRKLWLNLLTSIYSFIYPVFGNTFTANHRSCKYQNSCKLFWQKWPFFFFLFFSSTIVKQTTVWCDHNNMICIVRERALKNNFYHADIIIIITITVSLFAALTVNVSVNPRNSRYRFIIIIYIT